MGRTATFWEFTPATKAKWERLANNTANRAMQEAGGKTDTLWKKDEVYKHMHAVINDGYLDEFPEEIPDGMEDTYFERMKMASVFSGKAVASLDLVNLGYKDFAYQWIYNGRIPAGALKHVLSIAGGMARPAWDYFILLSREYTFESLVSAVEPKHAMTLLLLAELYARVHRGGEIDELHYQPYIDKIGEFKAEVQQYLTRNEVAGFNILANSLQLTG